MSRHWSRSRGGSWGRNNWGYNYNYTQAVPQTIVVNTPVSAPVAAMAAPIAMASLTPATQRLSKQNEDLVIGLSVTGGVLFLALVGLAIAAIATRQR